MKTLSQNQKRRAKLKKRRLCVTLTLLLIVAAISICLFTPFFNVKTVEVKGNSDISAEQIIKTAAIPDGINIFRVNTGKVKKALLNIPEIDSIRVRRLIPSKIRLEVTETKPVMSFSYLSGYVITNEAGRVMATVDTIDDTNLLNITGLEIKKAEICKKVSVQDTDKFDIILNTISALNRAGILQEIRSGHFDDMQNVHFYLHDGTKIIFGKITDLDYKLSVLTKVLVQVNRTEGAYIDLTTPERTYYGVIEPEPEEPEEGEEAEPGTEQAEGEQAESDDSEAQSDDSADSAEDAQDDGNEEKGEA
ncbi:MAG: FtsQ-type POTRA domain-containing protein [Ruminococcaceae bacterium]|nr:FtsQ-type POTRA domain-containing protein [Oscillospiraceae bacterium]